MPTWAERLPRGAAAVGVAAALVLLADLRAVSHLRTERPACGGAVGLPASGLEVTLRLSTAQLRLGDDVTGEAVVTNRTTRRVVLRRADAVLVAPGTREVESWTGRGRFRPVSLAPGTFARVPIVLHLASCPRGGRALAPGFQEVSLLLVEEEGGALSRTLGGSLTVVLPP